MTASNRDNTHDKNLRIAITGSLVVHALLFLLLAWMFAGDAAERLWKQAAAPPKQTEVMLLFPEQIMPKEEEKENEAETKPESKKKEIPPPPPLKPDEYIRTTQNQAATEAPKKPAFISDRNTTASTVKAPSPDATAEPLPTTDGMKTAAEELVNREYRGGDVKEDSAPASSKSAVSVVMPQPQPATRPSILKPKDAPSPPPMPTPQQPQPPAQTPPPSPPPQVVAKTPSITTPLSRLLDEADKELAREDKNRLGIELKKAEPATSPSATPTPPSQPQMQAQQAPPPTPAPPPITPPVREMAQTPPPPPMDKPVPKALPIMSEPLETPPPGMRDPNAYVPYTRTTQTKSTISNRGIVPSVDAVASPKGRYSRQVEGEIGKLWHQYSSFRRDTAPGRLEITFYVTKKGRVEGLFIQDQKQSNVTLTEFTLRAVKNAKIPPMPADVYPELPEFDPERLRFDFKFMIAPP